MPKERGYRSMDQEPSRAEICDSWLRSYFAEHADHPPGASWSAHLKAMQTLTSKEYPDLLPDGDPFHWKDLAGFAFNTGLESVSQIKYWRYCLEVLGPLVVLIVKRTQIEQHLYREQIRRLVEQSISRGIGIEWKNDVQLCNGFLARQVAEQLTSTTLQTSPVEAAGYDLEAIVDRATGIAIPLMVSKLVTKYLAAKATSTRTDGDCNAIIHEARRDLMRADPIARAMPITPDELRTSATQRAHKYRTGPFDDRQLLRLAQTKVAPAPPLKRSWLTISGAEDFLSHWNAMFEDKMFSDWVRRRINHMIDTRNLRRDYSLEDLHQYAMGELLPVRAHNLFQKNYVLQTYPYLDKHGNKIGNRPYWTCELLKVYDLIRTDKGRKPNSGEETTEQTTKRLGEAFAEMLSSDPDVRALRRALGTDDAQTALVMAGQWLRERLPPLWLSVVEGRAGRVGAGVSSTSWIASSSLKEMAKGADPDLAAVASRMASAAVTAWAREYRTYPTDGEVL